MMDGTVNLSKLTVNLSKLGKGGIQDSQVSTIKLLFAVSGN